MSESILNQKPKIVIHVDGGNVQDVYATDRHIDIIIVDFDNLRETEDSESRDMILTDETTGLYNVATREPETVEGSAQ